MKVVGITGRMGMGKSTVSGLIAKAGYDVLSADAIVRGIYGTDQHFIRTLKENFPSVFTNGKLDKAKWRALIFERPAILDRLNKTLHPLVFRRFLNFIEKKRIQGAHYIFLEVPLLFETDFHRLCDRIIVVSAPLWVQAGRIKQRGLPAGFVKFLLSRQCPDKLQRLYGDIIINTGLSMPDTKLSVRKLVKGLRG